MNLHGFLPNSLSENLAFSLYDILKIQSMRLPWITLIKTTTMAITSRI
jgi:hypothetical protein